MYCRFLQLVNHLDLAVLKVKLRALIVRACKHARRHQAKTFLTKQGVRTRSTPSLVVNDATVTKPFSSLP